MKVFVSWSGDKSKNIAKEIAKYIELIVPGTSTFLSEDIDKGARWSQEIAANLESSNFGIICLTKENQNAPWIQFEAGALAKSLEIAKVCPILLDLEVSDMVGNPLSQFQASPFKKEEFEKIILQIAKSISSDLHEKARTYFATFWDKMDEAIRKHLESPAITLEKNQDEGTRVLSAILNQQNSIMRRISNPEQLLPMQYLMRAFINSSDNSGNLMNLNDYVDEVDTFIEQLQTEVMFIDYDDPTSAISTLQSLEQQIDGHVLFNDRE